MKVYLIVHYQTKDTCRVHSVYTKEDAAEERAFHLARQFSNSGESFHVIKKSLKGKIKK